MPRDQQVDEFLAGARRQGLEEGPLEPLPVFDTRSPGEFYDGHIPGAIPLPLFSDEERATVGTLYKQVNAREALLKGLELVGPKMRYLVEQVDRLSGGQGEVAVYCWRGGSRSAAVATLLETAGYRVSRLIGGYKSFRTAVRQVLARVPHRFVVLDGPTGSGKTELLKAIDRAGGQVLDLEAIANNKGSAFGLTPGDNNRLRLTRKT